VQKDDLSAMLASLQEKFGFAAPPARGTSRADAKPAEPADGDVELKAADE
jgi:hypothetical protein